MRAAIVRAAALVLGLALGSACAGFNGASKPLGLERGEVTTTSGVKYEDTFLGTGPTAVVGDEVLFEYTCWLEDGTRVDSTADRGSAVRVVLGSAALKGWNDGLLGIQAQGERRIVIPPELAYGAEGLPGLIPPNSTLIFEVHVAQISHPKT
jgi:FKBP-type peptidyl-prolyl cis-trans isomerase